MYDYAERAHAPSQLQDKPHASCGSARATTNPLDDQPITRTINEFLDISSEFRCWECESIVA